MNLLTMFFRQKVPKNVGETPAYLLRTFKLIDSMLAIYFFLSFLLLYWMTGRLLWPPVVFTLILVVLYRSSGKLPIRVGLLLRVLVVCAWCTWYLIDFGWGVGGQHLLLDLILLVFFCVYEPPFTKIVYFLLILTLRMWLFSYTRAHEPLYALDDFGALLLQTVNSTAMFIITAGCCILFSSNLQDTERQLLLHNEMLQVQAETDPLTKLVNRRGFKDIMSRYVSQNPEAMYCVAIADIDFFKKVNDTYGHNCGDYVLQSLAELFTEYSREGYSVSRWGGEEFCFFFPGINIDEAGRIVTDLLVAVRRMPLEYEGHSFSITITAGVEENDFRSSLDELIESADRKLYRGKANGRDQIVF